VRVVLITADLVARLAAELTDVKRVKADLRVWNGGVDRLLIASGHVDRDRPDRLLLRVGEPVEERGQAGGVATFGPPHDPAGVVVGHTRQELMVGAIGDFVDADQLQAVQPVGGELL
jgi:hypothetical protein